MKKLFSILTLAVLIALLAACSSGSASSSAAPAASEDASGDAAQTGTEVEPRHVELEIAEYGVISLELYPAEAPETVANFIALAESGFYDGLTFHRIMDGFMMQGGDPDGNGRGGSDKTIPGEFAANGHENNISHLRGVISMARAKDPNSASSQFFIVQADSTYLDGNYAAFGRVTEGMEVVDAVCADARPVDNNGTIPPEQQPVITRVTVID